MGYWTYTRLKGIFQIHSLFGFTYNLESNATKYEEDALGSSFVDRVPRFLGMSRSFDNWSSRHFAMD